MSFDGTQLCCEYQYKSREGEMQVSSPPSIRPLTDYSLAVQTFIRTNINTKFALHV